jgi:hypothetical protein
VGRSLWFVPSWSEGTVLPRERKQHSFFKGKSAVCTGKKVLGIHFFLISYKGTQIFLGVPYRQKETVTPVGCM